ncbi:MAG: signal peptide peptidase SppA [Verrucomicrobia bacterium]|nr:MAG: signal peptide peptidase SppA [Verrucomicrobiota bacterium]
MKDFFKMLAACFVALGMWATAGFIFSAVLIGILIASSEQGPRVPKDAMLVLNLSMNVTDTPQADDDLAVLRSALVSNEPPTVHLRALLSALDAAAVDDRIKGIYIHGSFLPSGMGSGFGALKEVRGALVRFKESGKPILAYLRNPDTRDFYIASTADSISLNPMGDLITPGLAIERYYLADFFERYGIGVQVPHAGRYKSFGESLTRKDMSAEDKEQNVALLEDLWADYLLTVSDARGISMEEHQRVIDDNAIISPAIALEVGLVDHIEHISNVLARLRETTGVESGSKSFKQIDATQYIRVVSDYGEFNDAEDQVAVLYAEGTIVGGEGRNDQAGSDRIGRELRKLRHDDSVKAVVLRVNSPGGAAIAADIIGDEVLRMMDAKPVIVSMGSYATSGGYWISSHSDRIFAQENTITGSIGVVGIVPNIERLANDHGIFFDGVKTARHADMFTLSRPKTAEEMALFQTWVDEAYEKFISLVATGRGIDQDRVRELAQGRVWSGIDAVEIGLVDEIGGLADAVRYAAETADLDEYRVVDYPAPRNQLEEILKRLGGGFNPVASQVEGRVSRRLREMMSDLEMLDVFDDPRGVYAIGPILRIGE